MENTTSLMNLSENAETASIATGYRLAHGYVSGFVCFVGFTGNIINAVVWSRKNMLTSTNYILTALAVADAISLFMYFLYATYFFTATGPSELYYHTQAGMYLVVISFHEFLAFHTLANWLTISLAVFRYMKVCRSEQAKKYCNAKRAKIAILVTFIVTALATIPFYLYYEVYNLAEEENAMYEGYWLRRTAFAETYKSYQLSLLWLYGVIFKVVPSTAMIVLSILMIRKLREAKRRHDDLQKESPKMTSGYNRTTIMLLIIVFIYVITELPIGVTSFFAGLDATESHFFYFLLYSYIGDLIDLLACLNGTLNFFVYFALSRQYRATFKRVLLGKFIAKFSMEGTHEMSHSDTTGNQELSTILNKKHLSLHGLIRKSLKQSQSNASSASSVNNSK